MFHHYSMIIIVVAIFYMCFLVCVLFMFGVRLSFHNNRLLTYLLTYLLTFCKHR